MAGVYDLKSKDTGDDAGDTSFVLERKNTALDCRKNPDQFQCKDIAQFQGDDLNSTDLVLEFKVEVDGQWGPYLECNPVNVTNTTGDWHCTNGDPFPPQPIDFPKQC